jgi:tricorn protease-like protein
VKPIFFPIPAFRPTDKPVVFSYEGDLWKAGIADGQAVRLTAMQGAETNPKISPDGNGSHLPEDSLAMLMFL